MRNWAVNCSIMMQSLPLVERLEKVRQAGFSKVEFWWPFSTAFPDSAEVTAFVVAIQESQLELIAMNLYAGDMPGGERGVLSLPGREAEFQSSVEVATRVAAALGTRRFNALYGNRTGGADAAQDRLAIINLREAAERLASHHGTLLIEPVSGVDSYPIRTADDAASVVAKAESSNVRVLLDLFHLSQNGDDVSAAIQRHGANAGHVQIADAPGRGAPGSGTLPLKHWLNELEQAGYRGEYALEFLDHDVPIGAMSAGLLEEVL